MQDGCEGVDFAVTGLQDGDFVRDDEAQEPGADGVVVERFRAVGTGVCEGGGDEWGCRGLSRRRRLGWEGST